MVMKIGAIAFVLGFLFFNVKAQTTKTNIVEHFTNTSCSVCANNNDNIYNAVDSHSGTLHISFHPSSPYTSDVFNQTNKDENDGRTNFYNIFGGTPRTVVNGNVISINAINSELNSLANTTTNFQFDIEQTQETADSFSVNITITKLAADTSTVGLLFLGVSEDTINQTTNNGEPVHYNVFRKALTSVTGSEISLPLVIGETLEQSFGFKSSSSWHSSRLHTVGILQHHTKLVINAAISDNNESETLSLNDLSMDENIIFPNPSPNVFYISGPCEGATVYDSFGKVVLDTTWEGSSVKKIDLTKYNSGVYFVKLTDGCNSKIHRLILN